MILFREHQIGDHQFLVHQVSRLRMNTFLRTQCTLNTDRISKGAETWLSSLLLWNKNSILLIIVSGHSTIKAGLIAWKSFNLRHEWVMNRIFCWIDWSLHEVHKQPVNVVNNKSIWNSTKCKISFYHLQKCFCAFE